MSRRDPRVRHRFGVEIDGLLVGHFSAVAGISSEGEVVEFQEGGRNAGMLKLPGQGRLGTLRLKRGFTGEPALHRWASEGPGARRTVDVVLLDDAGAEVGRYTMHRAWPLKWEADSFDASSSAAAIESLELAYEGLTWAASGAARGKGAAGAGGGLAAKLGAAAQAVQGAQAVRRAAEQARQAAQAVQQAAANPAGMLRAAVQVSLPVAIPTSAALNAEWSARASGAVPQTPAEVSSVQSRMREGQALARQASDPAQAARDVAMARTAGAATAAGVPAPFQPLASGRPSAVPAAFQPSVSVGGRAFAHTGGTAPGSGSGGTPWSDGAAPVQSGAGFRQPPMRRGGFGV